MNINKAIRKQNKSYIRFMLTMSFIFLLLPEALFLSNKWHNILYLAFLFVIETLIVIVMLTVANTRLSFIVLENSIKLKLGIYFKFINIPFDRVVMVYTKKHYEKMEIILVTSSNLRSKLTRHIDNKLFRRFPDLNDLYTELCKTSELKDYYYFVLTNGGYNKYELLDELYKTCVRAYFTEETIDNIKEYRKWNN